MVVMAVSYQLRICLLESSSLDNEEDYFLDAKPVLAAVALARSTPYVQPAPIRALWSSA